MSSSAEVSDIFGSIPIATLEYRNIASGAAAPVAARTEEDQARRKAEREAAEAELHARIHRERAEATSQIERKLRQEYEQKLEAACSAIGDSVRGFAEQRDAYFARVEAEIVQLSLSIAARILHREAQVDPMLVASLVRISVERLREGSSVTIRVGPGRGADWRQYFQALTTSTQLEVVEDAMLNSDDCILETELGSANFSLEAQLKEVERGFFDLLALRPVAQ